MVLRGIIEEVTSSQDSYVSTVFLVAKPHGDYRVTLNLKQLNNSIEKVHFKMEHLKSALRLITPGFHMVSIDLKEAYYSVSIAKFLRFVWRGVSYQYITIKVGLLNTRSAKVHGSKADKAQSIHDLIIDNNLDILALTETWLRDDTSDALNYLKAYSQWLQVYPSFQTRQERGRCSHCAQRHTNIYQS